MSDQRAPATMAARQHSGMSSQGGSCGKVKPTHAEANAPMRSWPSAPQLNTPAREDTRKASAVNISGMDQRMDRAIL